jgi:hypothetical protein
MDFNRNQVFLVGVVLLLLGIHFHWVDAFVLTPQVTRLLADQTRHPMATTASTVEAIAGSEVAFPPKTIHHPQWLGWFLMSTGAVFILHSWSMSKVTAG